MGTVTILDALQQIAPELAADVLILAAMPREQRPALAKRLNETRPRAARITWESLDGPTATRSAAERIAEAVHW